MTRASRGLGGFVVLVGPDGVGKTSVARALVEQFPGPTAYFHFRPPILHDLEHAPPSQPPPPGVKFPRRGAKWLGWLRLAKHVVVCWLGHVFTVMPALRAQALVIGDRWSYGYLVQPGPLRFYGPEWLALLAFRVLPRPDMIVNLSAPAGEIISRKQELSESMIEAESRAWSKMPIDNLVTLSAEADPQVTATTILGRLNDG